MSFARIRVSVLGGALLLIAGCGGSSGGGTGSGGSGGGGNPTTVTFAITGGTPTAVATSTGSGSFTAATLTSGKVTLNLPSGTTSFAVAFVCPALSLTITAPSQQTYQYVFEASTLEGTSFSEPCPTTPATGTTGTLTGTVNATAVPKASFLNVLAYGGGGSGSYYSTALDTSFSLSAPVGTDRVEVVAYNSAVNGFVESFSLVAAKNFESQTVPGTLNGGSTVVLGAADETTPEPITYSNVPSGYGSPTTLATYAFANYGGIFLADAATSEYPALTADVMESGGYYTYTASSYATNNSGGEVYATTTSASGGPMSFTFPPAWSYAGPVAAAWPSFDLSYPGFSGKTGNCDEVIMGWSTSSDAEYYVQATVTGNYLNGATTVAVPNLSGLTGFLAAPASGTDVVWAANISQGNYLCLRPLPSDGMLAGVSNAGVYTVP